jgi:hypothetical protein
VTTNPFVVLGVEWGTTPDEAQLAFARLARGLRRAPGGVETLQELTRALNEIDSIAKDPKRAVEVYRIPSDPTAFVPPGLGVLRPPPERLGRTSPASTEVVTAFTESAVAESVLSLLTRVARSASLPPR